MPRDETETEHCGDYAVGYGRPPANTRFKPGESGNPRGRPKGSKGLKALVRTMMTAPMSVRTSAGVIKMDRVEALLLKIFELALKGDSRAQSQLLTLYAAAVPEPSYDALVINDAENPALKKLQELTHEFITKALEEK